MTVVEFNLVSNFVLFACRFKNFRFLNSSFRSLYGAFMLQFSFVLPLSVAIANDERRYSVYLEVRRDQIELDS